MSEGNAEQQISQIGDKITFTTGAFSGIIVGVVVFVALVILLPLLFTVIIPFFNPTNSSFSSSSFSQISTTIESGQATLTFVNEQILDEPFQLSVTYFVDRSTGRCILNVPASQITVKAGAVAGFQAIFAPPSLASDLPDFILPVPETVPNQPLPSLLINSTFGGGVTPIGIRPITAVFDSFGAFSFSVQENVSVFLGDGDLVSWNNFWIGPYNCRNTTSNIISSGLISSEIVVKDSNLVSVPASADIYWAKNSETRGVNLYITNLSFTSAASSSLVTSFNPVIYNPISLTAILPSSTVVISNGALPTNDKTFYNSTVFSSLPTIEIAANGNITYNMNSEVIPDSNCTQVTFSPIKCMYAAI